MAGINPSPSAEAHQAAARIAWWHCRALSVGQDDPAREHAVRHGAIDRRGARAKAIRSATTPPRRAARHEDRDQRRLRDFSAIRGRSSTARARSSCCTRPAAMLVVRRRRRGLRARGRARRVTVTPLLRFLAGHNIPHMLFINKMDRRGRGCATCWRRCRRVSTRPLVLRQVPIGEGRRQRGDDRLRRPGQRAGLSLQAERRLRADPAARRDLPRESEAARARCWRSSADFDDELLEKLLEDMQRPEKDLPRPARGARRRPIVPVLLGAPSARTACAGCGRRCATRRRRRRDRGAARHRRPGAPLAACFKDLHLAHAGKLSLCRVWAGAVAEGKTLGGQRVGGDAAAVRPAAREDRRGRGRRDRGAGPDGGARPARRWRPSARRRRADCPRPRRRCSPGASTPRTATTRSSSPARSPS